MPKKAFAHFHADNKLNISNTIKHSSNEKISGVSLPDDEIFQDITSFSESVANEIRFRFSILKIVAKECHDTGVTTKNIEPLRVKLQRESSRPIPSSITIYRWWLKYRDSNFNITSLAPKTKKKGNSSSKVPNIVSEYISHSIERVISAEKLNINNAFKSVRKKVRIYNLTHNTSYKYPSYETIRKRIKKFTPYEKLAKSKGERVARREFRRMGKKIQTESILERVEIDHTQLDLFAVHPTYRTTIGRPWLTQLVDCHSKSVIGFYLGFEPPSCTSLTLALKNAIKRKENLLANYPSVKGEWLCYGIPDLLVTDNGKEFLSKSFMQTCDSLFINVHQNKVETPDNKPHTERQYGTTNTSLLNDLPGKAFSNYLIRQGYSSENEAILTVDEITEIYLIWLIDIFHKKPNTRGTNCPNVTWNSSAKIWPPNEFKGTDDELDFCFADKITRSLRKEGIYLKTDLYYSSERLAEYRGRKGNHTVAIKYNPDNLGYIWVLDEDSESYFKVPAINFEYASATSLWLHEKNIELKKALSHTEYNQESEIDAELAIDKIVDKSISLKKTTLTNRKRAARYQENAKRAKNSQPDIPPQNTTFPSSSDSGVEKSNIDDDFNWEIDYV